MYCAKRSRIQEFEWVARPARKVNVDGVVTKGRIIKNGDLNGQQETEDNFWCTGHRVFFTCGQRPAMLWGFIYILLPAKSSTPSPIFWLIGDGLACPIATVVL